MFILVHRWHYLHPSTATNGEGRVGVRWHQVAVPVHQVAGAGAGQLEPLAVGVRQVATEPATTTAAATQCLPIAWCPIAQRPVYILSQEC